MMRWFSKKSGFSLIELAIILLVLSFVAVMFLESREQERTIGKQAIAHRQIETIQNAIETYAKAFGYYPCPADPTIAEGSGAGFGTNPDTGTGECQLTTLNLLDDSATSDKGIVMGMVPVRDLSIPFNNAYDVWGNKLAYVITKELTFTLAATGQITILKDLPASNPDNVITTNGVYIIMSMGEDGIGAYTKDGSQRISAAQMGLEIVDSEEQNENHHMYAGAGSFNDVFLRYYTHDPNVQFDDQLTWISRKVEPCKKIRTPWDYTLPIATAPQVWLDAAEAKTIIMNNGKEVTNGNFATWCDKSAGDTLPAFSYGKNFLSRPETGAASLNSLNVVHFDGINDGMLIDDVLSLPSTYTAFIVNRYYNTSALGRSLQGRDADWWFGLNEGGNHGHTNVATTAAGTAWHLSTVTSNGATARYYGNFTNGTSLNGAASSPGRLGLSSGAEPLGLRDVDDVAIPSSVEIAEVIVFDSDLSAVDVQDVYDVEDYLADKWGTCLGDEVYDSTDSRCECPDGSDATPPARSCCSAPRQVIGGNCVCPAPKTRWDGDSCECPENTGSDGNCYAACTGGQIWNAPSNSCVCPSGEIWTNAGGCVPATTITIPTSGWAVDTCNFHGCGCTSSTSGGSVTLRFSDCIPSVHPSPCFPQYGRMYVNIHAPYEGTYKMTSGSVIPASVRGRRVTNVINSVTAGGSIYLLAGTNRISTYVYYNYGSGLCHGTKEVTWSSPRLTLTGP